jgi:hypothetical protein
MMIPPPDSPTSTAASESVFSSGSSAMTFTRADIGPI